MPIKISVYGISKKAGNGDYREYEFSTEIDEDLTEEEAVKLVLEQVGAEGIYQTPTMRNSGQDRIVFERIGVQRDEPMIRLQPRIGGKFAGYDVMGRQLWAIEGVANTQPRDPITKRWISYENYAKMRGVSFATGEVSTRIKTTAADLADQAARHFANAVWKPNKSGAQDRKTAVTKIPSPYRQMSADDY